MRSGRVHQKKVGEGSGSEEVEGAFGQVTNIVQNLWVSCGGVLRREAKQQCSVRGWEVPGTKWNLSFYITFSLPEYPS